MLTLAIMVGIWLVSGGLGAWVAIQKNRQPGEGFWLGVLFGPFGVIVEALLPSGMIEKRTEPFRGAIDPPRIISSAPFDLSLLKLEPDPPKPDVLPPICPKDDSPFGNIRL